MEKTFPNGITNPSLLNSEQNLGSHNGPKVFFDNLILKIEHVTELLECSERHVRQLVSDDRIPHFYVGRLLRFHREKVLEWLLKGGTR